jgi:hypothetical protein
MREMRNTHRFLDGSPEATMPLRRYKLKCKIEIKMAVKETEC